MTRASDIAARALVGVLAAVLAAGPAIGQAEDLVIGYLEQKGDPRYGKRRTFARYLLQPLGRPISGARVALKEVKFHGAGAGVEFKLERVRERSAVELVEAVEEMSAEGVRYVLVDATADVLAELAQATRDREVLLFNVSAREDRLRQELCAKHLLHVIPSYSMLTDALAQYLVSRKWREVLVLEGPSSEDALFAAAFARSAKRFGIDIVETRPFMLSKNPRERSRNNVALLTAGVKYDVVFVADTDGEFARDLPFQVQRPRPVVGSEGLGPMAWHWSWERHGAPQLEGRFQKQAKRPMRSFDWAAWTAVKAVAEAVQRTGSADFAAVSGHLRSEEAVFDGFKGNRMNFRPWDNQLRQPILLATHNWVVARAPIDGFLHATNTLDTLGLDERDSQCTF